MTPEQLKLLSPAPWEAMVQEWQPPQVVCNDRTAGAIITGEAKQAVAWATFIAIARNAFDVMARRKWFPRFIGRWQGLLGSILVGRIEGCVGNCSVS